VKKIVFAIMALFVVFSVIRAYSDGKDLRQNVSASRSLDG
jgi:hypothetical protein